MRTIAELFLVFLKIGTTTFGGGYAMIPSFLYEITKKKQWMTQQEANDCLSICQALPGALIINAAIFVGMKKSGILGAFSAVLGMVIPAIVSILLIVIFIGRDTENEVLAGAMRGIQCVTVVLILSTAWNMSNRLRESPLAIVIAVTSLCLVVFIRVNAIWIILCAAILSVIYGRFLARKGGDRKCRY